jgi:AcrR family transcriptional regulator
VQRAEKRAQTRERLLEAASRVIAERGVEAATVDEIANRAGCSKGLVHYHFATKDDLVLEVVQHLSWAGKVPPAEQHEVAARLDAVLETDPMLAQLVLELVVYALRHEAVRDALVQQALLGLSQQAPPTDAARPDREQVIGKASSVLGLMMLRLLLGRDLVDLGTMERTLARFDDSRRDADR